MQRILLLGADGLLGSTFLHEIRTKNEFYVVSTAKKDSADLKFSYSPPVLLNLLKETKPDVVINCIAATSQDAKFLQSLLVNSLLPIQLALHSSKHEFRVIHFSSNAVFSGRKQHNTEKTWPFPKTKYGLTKLIGDISCYRNRVIRTSFVGVSPNNLVKKGLVEKLRSTELNDEVKVTNNFKWNGLTTEALVEVVLGLIRENDLNSGIFHLGTSGFISRDELTRSILKIIGRDDVVVKNVSRNASRNLTLETKKEIVISEWWQQTKYAKHPTFLELLQNSFD